MNLDRQRIVSDMISIECDHVYGVRWLSDMTGNDLTNYSHLSLLQGIRLK